MLSSYVHGGGTIGVIVEGSRARAPRPSTMSRCTLPRPNLVSSTVTRSPTKILATEKEIAIKQAIEQGKPEQIAEKIVAGKMEKFFESEVLLEQPFAKDTSISVGEHVAKAGGAGCHRGRVCSIQAR